jgi:hypothetical protein
VTTREESHTLPALPRIKSGKPSQPAEVLNYRYDKNVGTLVDKYNAQDVHLRRLSEF